MLDHVIVGDINNILSLHVLCVNFPFFILGHICRTNSKFKSVLDNNITYTIAILSYMPLQLLYMRTGSFLYHGGAAISAIVVFIQLFQNIEFGTVGRGLLCLGSQTIDIYLYHGFVLGLFNLQMFSSWVCSSSNLLIEIIVSVLIAIVTSVVCIGIGKVIKHSTALTWVVYGNR